MLTKLLMLALYIGVATLAGRIAYGRMRGIGNGRIDIMSLMMPVMFCFSSVVKLFAGDAWWSMLLVFLFGGASFGVVAGTERNKKHSTLHD